MLLKKYLSWGDHNYSTVEICCFLSKIKTTVDHCCFPSKIKITAELCFFSLKDQNQSGALLLFFYQRSKLLWSFAPFLSQIKTTVQWIIASFTLNIKVTTLAQCCVAFKYQNYSEVLRLFFKFQFSLELCCFFIEDQNYWGPLLLFLLRSKLQWSIAAFPTKIKITVELCVFSSKDQTYSVALLLFSPKDQNNGGA